jgi:hypothetical protein
VRVCGCAAPRGRRGRCHRVATPPRLRASRQRTCSARCSCIMGRMCDIENSRPIRRYPLPFPSPPDPSQRSALSPDAVRRVRAVRATTAVNKNNVSGRAAEHLLTLNNNTTGSGTELFPNVRPLRLNVKSSIYLPAKLVQKCGTYLCNLCSAKATSTNVPTFAAAGASAGSHIFPHLWICAQNVAHISQIFPHLWPRPAPWIHKCSHICSKPHPHLKYQQIWGPRSTILC